MPFDNFYTNDLNSEQHIQFTLNNGNWLMSELDNNPIEEFFSCASLCPNNIPISVIGTNQICHFNQATYSINNLRSGVPVTWSVSPSGGFTMTTNGNNVTLMPNGNFSGTATLTATIITDCGNLDITKEIQTGSQRPIYYDLSGNEQASFSFCTLQYDNINFTTPFNALEWEWTKVSGNFNMLVTNNQAQFFSNYPTSGIVTVRSRDNCGWSVPTFLVINFSNCSGGGFGNFKMAQNPISGGRLTVIERENNNGDNANRQGGGTNKNSKATQNRQTAVVDINFELYDYTGLMRASWTEQRDTQDWDYNFDVSQYENGNYFIRISCGDISEMYQIIIEN